MNSLEIPLTSTSPKHEFPDLLASVGGRRIIFQSKEEDAEQRQQANVQAFVDSFTTVNTRTLSAVVEMFSLAEKFLALCGITHIDFEKYPFQVTNLLVSLLIMREIITTPVEHRPETYTTEKVFKALESIFTAYIPEEETFFTHVKDLFPTDDSEKSQLIKRLAFFMQQARKISTNFDFLTRSKMIELQEIDKTTEGEARMRSMLAFYDAAQEVPENERFLDHERQLALASEVFFDVVRVLDPELQRLNEEIERILRVLEKEVAACSKAAHKRTSRTASAKDVATAGSTILVQRHLGITLPSRIRRKLLEIETLRKRIKTLATITSTSTVVQAKPLVQKIMELMTLMIKKKEEVLEDIKKAKILLSMQLPKSEDPEVKEGRKRLSSELLRVYIIHVHTLITDMTVAICKDLFAEGKSIRSKRFTEIYNGVVGHICLAIECNTKEARPYIQAAEKLDLTERAAAILKVGKKTVLENLCKVYIDTLAGNDESLKQALGDVRLKAFEGVFITILLYEFQQSNHKRDLDSIKTSLASISGPPSRENTICCLQEMLELKVEGAENLHQTTDSFRLIIAAVINEMYSLNLKELDHGTAQDTSIFLMTLCSHLDALKEASLQLTDGRIYSCSLLSALANPVVNVAKTVAFGLDQEQHAELTSAENARKKEAQQVADVAYKELLAELEEDEEDVLVADVEVVVEDEPNGEVEVQTSPVSPLASPKLDVTPQFPTVKTLSAITTLGKTTVSPSAAAHAQSQIYVFQTLTIIAHILRNPRVAQALLPSLQESMHLSLEQAVTAQALVKRIVTLAQLNSHRLGERFRQCGCTALSPEALSISPVGTYIARYPHINENTMHGSSIASELLRVMTQRGELPPPLLFKLVASFNALLCKVEGLPPVPDFNPEAVKAYCLEENLAPCRLPKNHVEATIRKVITRFPKCDELEDVTSHLRELHSLMEMINQGNVIPKELLGTVLHALFRIRQYTYKNTLTLLLKEKLGEEFDPDAVPNKPEEIAAILRMPADMIAMIENANMLKGLDYPLGRRNRRPLSENESALVMAHRESLIPVGFEMQSTTSSSPTVVKLIESTFDEIQRVLDRILAQ